jgi:hypothetical protein
VVGRPTLQAGSKRWRPKQTHPGLPRGPRNRSRSSLRMRLRCANRISIFFRSRRNCSKPSVPPKERATSRARSRISRGILRDGSLGALRFEWAYTALASGGTIQKRLVITHRAAGPDRPGSGRSRWSGHIESRCARRCHRLAATCRSSEIEA